MTSTGIQHITFDDLNCTGTSTITNYNVTGTSDYTTLNTNNINPGLVASFPIQNNAIVIDNGLTHFGGLLKTPIIQPATGTAVTFGALSQFAFDTSTDIFNVDGTVTCNDTMTISGPTIVDSGPLLIGGAFTVGELRLTDYSPYYMSVTSGPFGVGGGIFASIGGTPTADNITFTYAIDTVTVLSPGFYITSAFINNVTYPPSILNAKFGVRISNSASPSGSAMTSKYNIQTVSGTNYTFTLFAAIYISAPGALLQLQALSDDISGVDSYTWNIMKVK